MANIIAAPLLKANVTAVMRLLPPQLTNSLCGWCIWRMGYDVVDDAHALAVEAIKVLLMRGAMPDINLADKWNRQPLHWAVLNAHLSAVEVGV